MAIPDTSGAQHTASSVAGSEERGTRGSGSGRATGDQHPDSTQRTGDEGDSAGIIPSSVIHELRTPLTAIHGYAQILHRSLNADPSKARAVNVLLSESTRLAAMLNQLSEVSEIDSQPAEPEPSQVDVRELVGALVEQQRKKAPNHSFSVDGTATARCEARRLAQALTHILDNAVAYSPDGGEVRVGLDRQLDGAHVSIRDEGIGVPPDEADRVFRRYWRGSNAKREGVRGLGIGLYVAHQAVLGQGGRIWHTPADGQGTVFYVVIPDA